MTLDELFTEYANLLNQGFAPHRHGFPEPDPCPQCGYAVVYSSLLGPSSYFIEELMDTGCPCCGLGFCWFVGMQDLGLFDKVVKVAWAWAPVRLALSPADKVVLAELME